MNYYNKMVLFCYFILISPHHTQKMATHMEIEEQHVDEGFVLFQAKAENLLQKRQKLIDGKTKSPLLRLESHCCRFVLQLGEDLPRLLGDVYYKLSNKI
jgi:hypothetical protein